MARPRKEEIMETQQIDAQEKDTTFTFMDKISQAQLGDEEWVETSPEIMAHYNRKGMGGQEYFIFQGIKVCEYGKRQSLEDKLNEDMAIRLHGKQIHKFEGRT